MRTTFKIYLICGLFLLNSRLFAQVNIKVAYNLGFVQTEVLDNIVQQFNDQNSFRISNQLESVDFASGIDIGLRYNFGNANVELFYDNLSTDKEALGEEPSDGSLFKERYFYNQKGFGLSLELKTDKLAWGIGLLNRSQVFRTNISTSDEKRDVLRHNHLALKLHTGVYFGGTGTISFGIKPFYIFPLSRTDLTPLSSEWDLSPGNPSADRFGTFGLSFVFYNGPQG